MAMDIYQINDVPRTMEELLSTLPQEKFQIVYSHYVRPSRKAPLSKGESAKDNPIREIVKSATSVNAMKDLAYRLSGHEAQFLKEGIRLHGLIPVDPVHQMADANTLESLCEKGLLFHYPYHHPEVYVIPLQICIGIPLDGLQVKSLLRAFYTYSAEGVKRIAMRAKAPYQQLNKLKIASTLYKRFLQEIPSLYRGISDDERLILRTVFEHDHPIDEDILRADGRLQSLVSHEKGHPFWSRPIISFLTSSYYRQDEDQSRYSEAAISLIVKGLLAVDCNQYFNRGALFIPDEVAPVIEEDYRSERRAIIKGIEGRLPTDAPLFYESYSSQILFDLIRVQIALIGVQVSVTKKDEVSARVISQMSKLLDRSELYIENLLANLKHLEISNHRLIIRKIEADALTLLRERVFRESSDRAMAKVLSGLDGWLHADSLIRYLLNHDALFVFRALVTTESIKDTLQLFFLNGLIEKSGEMGDGQVSLRATPLLRDLLSAEEQPVPQLLLSNDKPVVVQPNMEILVPWNTEQAIIEKLSTMADMTVIDKMIHMSITKDSVMRAFDHGLNAKGIKDVLSSLSRTPLPRIVEQFIDGFEERRGEVVIIPCTGVIITKGLGTAGKVSKMNRLGIEAIKGVENLFLIRDTEPQKVLEALKKAGIFADLDGGRSLKIDSLTPAEIKSLLHLAYHADHPVSLTYRVRGRDQQATIWIENVEKDHVMVFSEQTFRTHRIPIRAITAISKQVEEHAPSP